MEGENREHQSNSLLKHLFKSPVSDLVSHSSQIPLQIDFFHIALYHHSPP